MKNTLESQADINDLVEVFHMMKDKGLMSEKEAWKQIDALQLSAIKLNLANDELYEAQKKNSSSAGRIVDTPNRRADSKGKDGRKVAIERKRLVLYKRQSPARRILQIIFRNDTDKKRENRSSLSQRLQTAIRDKSQKIYWQIRKANAVSYTRRKMKREIEEFNSKAL